MLNKELPNKLYCSLNLNKRVGNIYTGSLYLSLISLALELENNELRNKKLFMYSYGSGVATTLYSIKVNPHYDKNKFLNLSLIRDNLKTRSLMPIEDFDSFSFKREQRYNKNNFVNIKNMDLLWDNSYYLHSVDDKGQRTYVYIRSKEDIKINRILFNVETEKQP